LLDDASTKVGVDQLPLGTLDSFTQAIVVNSSLRAKRMKLLIAKTRKGGPTALSHCRT
jgi:hypothetical protein